MADPANQFVLTVDVTGVVGGDTESSTCVTVYLPSAQPRGMEPVVMAFAGAGYNRSYYDIGTVGAANYSMATHFTDRGCIFIACDHVGTGDSSFPDGASLSLERIADADAETVRGVLAYLRVHLGVTEWSPSRLIGIGHSMGGCLLTLQQARHSTFDSIALLGWSGLHTVVPAPPPDSGIVDNEADYRNTDGTPDGYIHWHPRPPALQWAFVLEDTDRGALALDMTSAFPASVMTMSEKGVVASEAAVLTIPILLAFGGERDVALDPQREVSAYPNSKDVTLFILPDAAHCHNFAGTRAQLWDQILQWIPHCG